MPTLVSIPKNPPWVTQYLVIKALMIREMTTRFGKYHLGFFWMLFEPLMGTVIIGIVIGGFLERAVPEIPYAFFLLQGFLLLHLFTGPMTSGMRTIKANKGLLVYPTVKPLDPFIARFLMELLTTVFSLVVFLSISMWIGVTVSLGNLQVLAACYLLTWLCGAGFGLIFGVAAEFNKEVEKIVPVLQRPLLFVSCVFFPLSSIPEAGQEYLLYNPLVHTIELSRVSLFPHYPTEQVNLMFPTLFATVVLSIGLVLFHNNRNFLTNR